MTLATSTTSTWKRNVATSFPRKTASTCTQLPSTWTTQTLQPLLCSTCRQTSNNSQTNDSFLILTVPIHRFNIYVRRLGGAFGAKISRNTICSNAALLACYKLGKPVKMWLPLHVNMQIVGKRLPCSVNYEAGLNAQGKIQYMNMEFYSDYGVGCNEPVTYFAYDAMLKQTYDLATWNVGIYSVRTDTPAGTWCRAPGIYLILNSKNAFLLVFVCVVSDHGVYRCCGSHHGPHRVPVRKRPLGSAIAQHGPEEGRASPKLRPGATELGRYRNAQG